MVIAKGKKKKKVYCKRRNFPLQILLQLLKMGGGRIVVQDFVPYRDINSMILLLDYIANYEIDNITPEEARMIYNFCMRFVSSRGSSSGSS